MIVLAALRRVPRTALIVVVMMVMMVILERDLLILELNHYRLINNYRGRVH